jgi:hypothetical protein
MLDFLHAPTEAAQAALTSQVDQVAGILSIFGAGNVTILSYAGATLAHTSTHGPMTADALTPRGWAPGAAPIATTVNVAGATITRQVFRNSSGVDIYSLDGADITPAPLITRTGKRHRYVGRGRANSSLPVVDSTVRSMTWSAADTGTVNIGASGSITNTGNVSQAA